MPRIADRIMTEAQRASLQSRPAPPEITAPHAPAPDPNPPYGFSPGGNPSPYRGFLPVEESLDSDIGAGYPIAARFRRTFSGSDSRALEQVLVVESHAFGTSRTAAARSVPVGAPQNVNFLKLSEAPFVTSTGTFSKVSVSFQRNAADQFWASANIWVSNYQGSAAPTYITSIQSSPSSFLLAKTGELVTVTVVSVSTTGVLASFSSSPSTVVRLS